MHRLSVCAVLLSLPLMAGDIDEARAKFPPEATRAVLEGRVPAPEGFDEQVAKEIGEARLAELRGGGAQVSGHENDVAALVLVQIGAKPIEGPVGGPGGGHGQGPGRIEVVHVDSEYPAASGKTGGSFHTGQDADLMLSGIDFDETGGPLLFNHPMGIASDGARLFLADTYNNRVLVWSKLPEGNVEPDLVLGQKDFHANAPGDGRRGMNFPVNVATDGKRVLVADTDNDRILIWNACPKENGAPADLVLGGGPRGPGLAKDRILWPWGVWSDGRKVAVSSTQGGSVLVWNSFPTRDGQPADVVLTGGGKIGTPRTITSDGRRLIVGDHNARERSEHGAFVWTTWPSEGDPPHDFFLTDPFDERGAWPRGAFGADGALWLLASSLYRWDAFPKDASARPDLALRRFNFHSGDHTGVAIAGGRVYVCTGNLNKVVVYDAEPTSSDAMPDFAIGAPDLGTNTLETEFILSNPVPASDGKHLFASSDFDGALYVWKRLPDRSGAHPDLVYRLDGGPMGIALHGDRLVLAGHSTVWVWDKLPLEGDLPDRRFDGKVGGVRVEDLRGVALDDRYLYLSDARAGRIHVFRGIPGRDDAPVAELEVENPWRVMSDGTWLVAGTGDRHEAYVWEVSSIEKGGKPRVIGGRGRFNWVQTAFASHGRFFVVEAGSHRVHVWERVEDALGGRPADALIGQPDEGSKEAAIGRARLHTPATAWFDGAYLWVGETKFSERLLRFSPK